MADIQKEIGRMKLNAMDTLVFQTSQYKGKNYIDIRKWVESTTYTGFTKQGIRFHADLLHEFFENLKKVAEQLNVDLEVELKPEGIDTETTASEKQT